MRIPCFLLAVVGMARAEFPEDVSFSGDCAWVHASPVVSPYVQAVNGQGFRIEPALEARFFEHLSLRTHAGYQLVGWGASRTSSASSFFGVSIPGMQVDSSYRLQVLTLGTALQLEFLSVHKIFLSAGVSLETPLEAHYEVESWVISPSGARTKQLPVEGSFGGDLKLGYFDYKAGAQIWRSLGLMAGVRFPMKSDVGPKLNQILAGVRWSP
jgi:hypothetical protein